MLNKGPNCQEHFPCTTATSLNPWYKAGWIQVFKILTLLYKCCSGNRDSSNFQISTVQYCLNLVSPWVASVSCSFLLTFTRLNHGTNNALCSWIFSSLNHSLKPLECVCPSRSAVSEMVTVCLALRNINFKVTWMLFLLHSDARFELQPNVFIVP